MTGTSMPAVIVRHMPKSTSRPIDFTVLTDVWTMTGARSSTAAARTASSVRSLTMLNAADAVPLLERAVEHVLERDDRHGYLPVGGEDRILRLG